MKSKKKWSEQKTDNYIIKNDGCEGMLKTNCYYYTGKSDAYCKIFKKYCAEVTYDETINHYKLKILKEILQ